MPETAQSIADRIHRNIETGALPPGAKLPSITELAQQYGVGVGAANQALQALRTRGLVTARHGVGVFVRTREPAGIEWRPPLGFNRADSGEVFLQPRAFVPATVLSLVEITVDQVPAPAFAAERLDVPLGVVVVRRARMFEHEGKRAVMATSYLPWDIAGGTALERTDCSPGGVYAQLAQMGFGLEKTITRTHPRHPSGEERDLLELWQYAAVVGIDLSVRAGGRWVEVTRMVFDADKFYFSHEWLA